MATRRESPGSGEDVAALLAACTAEGEAVRTVGGATKTGWGRLPERVDLELSTASLDRIVEHNEGDLTAVLQAGVALAVAQERFAAAGQMLALDPPLGAGERATLGGVVATGDSGPRRHRYGAPRDLVLGVTVALPDGTLARAGGKVIKNVAGYDLGKLFAGSLGTLGVIVELAVRLHPFPHSTATAALASPDPDALAAAASLLAHAPLELECLDVSWSAGEGAVLARFAGQSAERQAQAALELLRDAPGEATVVSDDESRWAGQRAGQRSAAGAVVRISGVQSQLPQLLRWVEREGASLVGRAGLGLSWATIGADDVYRAAASIAGLRRELSPAACVLLDAPDQLRELVDPWGPVDAGTLALARRVKARFDPTATCSPGVFVGGI
ncbi:MAG: glycolate oxidase binding subunit [Solirubrobacteraceae bacterium]|nr:glycolate oxidase binding subunit [Solirubrobacteraceae bacterium]